MIAGGCREPFPRVLTSPSSSRQPRGRCWVSSSSGPGACASCWVYQASESLTSLSPDLSGVAFRASNLEEWGVVYRRDEERVCFLPALEEAAAPRSGLGRRAHLPGEQHLPRPTR